MRIALCLYGQPRDYVAGFHNLDSFIKRHPGAEYDTFFHVWHDRERVGHKFVTRLELPENLSHIQEDTMDELLRLYKPKNYLAEGPIQFDIGRLKKSLMYQWTRSKCDKEQYIHLSQMYSRNEVRKLFEKYISDTNIKYDFIIHTRFDFIKPIQINLNILDPRKIYMSNVMRPSGLKSDNMIILNQDNFVKCFDLYNFTFQIMDSSEMQRTCFKKRIRFEVIIECIILMSFIHYGVYQNLVFTSRIPNFS